MLCQETMPTCCQLVNDFELIHVNLEVQVQVQFGFSR